MAKLIPDDTRQHALKEVKKQLTFLGETDEIINLLSKGEGGMVTKRYIIPDTSKKSKKRNYDIDVSVKEAETELKAKAKASAGIIFETAKKSSIELSAEETALVEKYKNSK